MAFEDFIAQFQKIYICRLFDQFRVIQPTLPPNFKKKGTPAVATNGVPAAVKDAPVGSSVKAEQKDIPRPSVSTRAPLMAQPAATTAGAAGANVWYRCTIEDEFPKGAGSPFQPLGPSPESNPQYTVQLAAGATRPAVAFCTLTQPTWTPGMPMEGESKYRKILLMLLDKEGKRARQMRPKQVVAPAKPSYRITREVTVEANIEPGKVYTLFPSTRTFDRVSKMTITVYCRSPFILTPLDETTPLD
jgi:hypothetical protein